MIVRSIRPRSGTEPSELKLTSINRSMLTGTSMITRITKLIDQKETGREMVRRGSMGPDLAVGTLLRFHGGPTTLQRRGTTRP